MVNPKRGELQVKLGTKQLKAKLTIDSLMRIETSNGCSVIQTAKKLSNGECLVDEIANVIQPALKGGGSDLTHQDVLKMIWSAGLVDSMRVAGEILTVALSTGVKDEGNEVAEENQKT